MKLLTLCLALLACAVCLAQPPVADLRFDDGQGRVAADASPSAHNARVFAADWVPGKSGTALSFASPEARVRLGRRPWLNLDQAITLEAWICPPEPGDQSRIIVAKNDEYLLRIDKQPEGGRISFFVHVGTPAVSWEPRVSSKEPPEPNRWTHVVVTWDGAMLRMYLDGELQAERPRTGFPNPNPYPVIIGNFEYPTCHGCNFGGIIDEVRIYDRALSQAEIGCRHQTGAAPCAPGEDPQ